MPLHFIIHFACKDINNLFDYKILGKKSCFCDFILSFPCRYEKVTACGGCVKTGKMLSPVLLSPVLLSS